MNTYGRAPTTETLNDQVLREVVMGAVSRSADEHTILYIHGRGIAPREFAVLHATLDNVTRALSGPAVLAAVGSHDFALFVEAWPCERAERIARLIRAVIQRSELRLGTDSSIKIGVLGVRNVGADIDALLEYAEQMCRARVTNGGASIEILRLEHPRPGL